MSGLDGVWGGEYDGRREALRDLPAHDEAAIVHATLYVGDQLARIADAVSDAVRLGGPLDIARSLGKIADRMPDRYE
jgi:hypothetical protein